MVDFVHEAMEHLHNAAPSPDLNAMSLLDLLKVYGRTCNAWGHFSAELAAMRAGCRANNMSTEEEELMTARVRHQDDRAVALAQRTEAKLKVLLEQR
jgi:hypothetical protein